MHRDIVSISELEYCQGWPATPKRPLGSPQCQPTTNCPLRHSPADCYIVRMRRFHEPHRRSREGGNLASPGYPCVDVGAVREPPEGHATPNVPPTDDNCPLRHSPADCYIVHIRRLRKDIPSFPRRLRSLLPMGEGEGEGSDDRECNQMQPNATEIKGSPLLATPDEANQSRNQGRLAHRLRVSGGPNEATVASFPASPPGVNRAKQGQMGPGFTPLQVPSPLRGEG